MQHVPVLGKFFLILALLGLIIFYGCGGGEDEFVRISASASTLQQRAFVFPDAAAFGLAGSERNLTFGDFDRDGDGNPNTGLFTLDFSASGTVTLTGTTCGLLITESSFAKTLPGLQPRQTLRFDPCTIAPADGSLRVKNTATGIVSTSAPPLLPLRVTGQVERLEIEGGCFLFHGDNHVDYRPIAGPGVSLREFLIAGAMLVLDLIPANNVGGFCPGVFAEVVAIVAVTLPR